MKLGDLIALNQRAELRSNDMTTLLEIARANPEVTTALEQYVDRVVESRRAFSVLDDALERAEESKGMESKLTDDTIIEAVNNNDALLEVLLGRQRGTGQQER